MARLSALLAALAVASSAAASPSPDAAVAAALEQGDETCEASDVECALSLRQLRATALAPDTADAPAPPAAKAQAKPAVAASKEATPLQPVTLADTLQKKPGQYYPPGGWYKPPAQQAATIDLFHMTSPYLCGLIQQTGFKPGSAGWCGGAIYFAQTASSVKTKAIGTQSHWGCMLEAQVDVGRILEMGPKCDQGMTGEKLASMGYDSIKFNPGDGNEFVVYDPSLIKSMHVVWRDPNVPDGSNELAPNRVR